MEEKTTPPSDNYELHVNKDQPEQELIVILNTMDDEGGFDGAVEGGKYLLPGIKAVLADTRMKITELDAITMDLSREIPGDPSARYLKPITKHASIAADQVYQGFMEGKKVLSLGGNHVRALDVTGAMRACHEKGIPFGVIWMDAHPDLNTPQSTVTGHIHGMPAAVLQGRGAKELLDLLKGAPFVDPQNFIYIGVNAIDNPKNADGSERAYTELKYLRELDALGVRCVTIDGKKIGAMEMKESLKEAKIHNRVPEEVKQVVTELSYGLAIET